MAIPGDNLRDLRINEDREVEVGADGDLRQTSGIDTVEQSVAIHAGEVLRPLIGEPLTDQTYADIEAEVATILRRDPQIENVDKVSIQTVNKSSGTVTLEVFTSYNNSFTIEPNVQ